MSNKKHKVISNNNAPWTGLDTNLDWNIEKRALIVHGLEEQIDTHYALVRSDNDDILGICGANYIPLQNEQAFQFINRFIEAGSMTLEAVGSLRDGRYTFALAKINESFVLPGDDEVGAYLLISKPHVWGKAMNIKFTNVRVVCMNTLLTALSDKYEKFRFPHIKDFDEYAMKTAEDVLGLSKISFSNFKRQATFLSQRPFNSKDILEFASIVFQKQKEVAKIFSTNSLNFLETLETQPGAEMLSAKGTWWGALNAVTYLCDHKIGKHQDTRLYQAWYGGKEVMKRKALDLALKYAKGA